MDRRALLKSGVGIVSVALAGCNTDSGNDPATQSTDLSTDTPTASSATQTPETQNDSKTPTPEVIDELDSLEGAWPTYGRDNQRQSAVTEGTFPDSSPARRWSISLGSIVGQPLLVDGMIYAQIEAGKLFKLEGTTGSVQWVYDLGRDPEVEPVTSHRMAVGEDRVYVLDQRRQLHAIDRETAEPTLRKKVSTADRSSLFYGQAVPTVVNDRVLLAEYPRRLLGFDRKTGEQVVDSSITTAGFPWPTLAERDGNLFAASSGSAATDWIERDTKPSITKFDPDGKHEWTANQTSEGNVNSRSPVIDGDRVYLTDGYHGYAFSAKNGEFRWKSNPSNQVTHHKWHSPAVGEKRLYYANHYSSSSRAGLGAVSTANGSTVWRSEGYYNTSHEPIVLGDGVLVPASDYIFAYSIPEESMVWKLNAGGASVIAGTDVVITGSGSTITAWA